MRPEEDWQRFVLSRPEFITYQLLIRVEQSRSLTIGRLGCFDFPPGNYLYTGSARYYLVSRVRRHLSRHKTLRWHIDYLLADKETRVTDLQFSDQPECMLNQQSDGEIVVPGFGASDCRARCGSHLKFLGVRQ